MSTVTSMEWLDPGGSNSGASVHDRLAVGTGEQSHCGMSGTTALMVTAPPAPGPARIVAASQMVIGSSGSALPLLVTVMVQWMGPPNGAGVHTLLDPHAGRAAAEPAAGSSGGATSAAGSSSHGS